jgi:DNA-binding transcriptional LysR family regulator
MVLSDRNVQLIDDQVDMAVRIGTLPDSSMVATRIGSVSRVVCASPHFLAAHGTPKTPADLADLPCVTFDALAAGSAWLFASADRKLEQSVPIRARLCVNTAEAVIDAAIAGVGLTQALSYQAARAVDDGKLKLVLRKFERDPIPVNLIHAGQGLLPLKMRRFLEFAAPRLRKSLTADPGTPRK